MFVQFVSRFGLRSLLVLWYRVFYIKSLSHLSVFLCMVWRCALTARDCPAAHAVCSSLTARDCPCFLNSVDSGPSVSRTSPCRQIPKSHHTQVPYIKWYSALSPLSVWVPHHGELTVVVLNRNQDFKKYFVSSYVILKNDHLDKQKKNSIVSSHLIKKKRILALNKGTFFNLMNNICKSNYTNVTLSCKMLQAFPLRLGMRLG